MAAGTRPAALAGRYAVSRGPGRVMRGVLDSISGPYWLRHDERREWWHPAHIAAWHIARDDLAKERGKEPAGYEVHVSPSLRESVRRAIHSLEREGLVETCLRYDADTGNGWLHFRLAPDEWQRRRLSEGGIHQRLAPENAGNLVRQLQEATP